MKKFVVRTTLYGMVAVLVGCVFMLSPGYRAEVTPLGSVLSIYFYNRFAAKEDLSPFYQEHTRTITDPKLKEFYKKFNWSEKKVNCDYSSDVDKTWEVYDPEGEIKGNYLQYWQTIRPFMRQFYATTIAPMEVPNPIVHFRCSDSPWVRYPAHHLTKRPTVEWIADKIKARGYNKVVVLFCNKHRRFKNNRCADFMAYYEHILKQSGLMVERQCHDIYHDFALMVNAPLLVSLNSSNYAFMAGIAKEPHNYISNNLGREIGSKYFLSDQADWIMDSRPPLLHKDVPDYNRVKDVIAKLES